MRSFSLESASRRAWPARFARPTCLRPISCALYNEYVGSPQLCVFCRKHPVSPAWRPFCSERCKLLDLAQWVDGSYRVAAEPAPSPDEASDEDDESKHA